MRFLFVRPEFCPLGDLLTPKIRLSSDSTSRWTPLPLANPSRYRADSGLSPYRTCAHRAHYKDLAELNYEIRQIRKDIKMCEKIQNRVPAIQKTLKRVDPEPQKKRKKQRER